MNDTVNNERETDELPSLSQDPHKVDPSREKVLEIAVGRAVRNFRRKQNITVSELAASANLSVGMLSKIENGLTSASLTTLQSLSQALSIPLTSLFRGFEEQREAVHVKAGTGVVAERAGSRAGHHYTLLGHLGSNTSGVIVEPYLITLNHESDTFPTFQHEGTEFIYMLEGEIEYRHGDRRFHLKPGDSLFFDADAPHGPERHVALPALFLSVISYPQSE